MNPILKNKKTYQVTKDFFGCYFPRCYWKKAKGTLSPRVLIKCGDCDAKLEIYYPEKNKKDDDWFEINGVLAHKDWWKMLFKEVGL